MKKILLICLNFIVRHLPWFLRWSADHIDNVVDDCDVCAENSHQACDDCASNDCDVCAENCVFMEDD